MSARTPCVVTLMFVPGVPESVWLSERTGTNAFVGYWQGGGGRLEKDKGPLQPAEGPVAGALRELREEAGIDGYKRLVYLGCDREAIASDGGVFPLHYFIIKLEPGEVPQNTEPELHGPWTQFTREQTAKLKLMPGLAHKWFKRWIDFRR